MFRFFSRRVIVGAAFLALGVVVVALVAAGSRLDAEKMRSQPHVWPPLEGAAGPIR